jgi:hypothetical protein
MEEAAMDETHDEQRDDGPSRATEDADKRAEEKVAALEDDPPKDLDDWPDDEAKYKTFGGAEGDSGYDEGPTAKLGSSNVRHHEDGSVTVDGEQVDNPEDYKGDPIPGGPTDPSTPKISGEKDLTEE